MHTVQVLVVSHDQHFLNAVATDIVLLEARALHYFPECDFDAFKRKHASLSAELRLQTENGRSVVVAELVGERQPAGEA